MTREEFIAKNPIQDVLESRGIQLRGKVAKCPLHEDRNPSFSVDFDNQVWHCHAGCGGGSVIDLLARLEGVSPQDYMRREGIGRIERPMPGKPQQRGKIVATYDYQDALGGVVYQAVRMEPKDFRQRRPDGNGGWLWNLEGVERMLFRLPDVMKAETVSIAEGEKDALTLVELGYCGTCNVGGAGKWMDGYTESLAGKDVLIFGDNDEPGRKHVEKVFESIAGRVKCARLVDVPKAFKDVTEWRCSFPTLDGAKEAVAAAVAQCVPFVGGVKLPLYTMAEIEARYARHVADMEGDSFDLRKWLPSLRRIRPIVPGELMMVIANTGVGKTALLSSIAIAAKPLPTLFFQMELPEEMVFERLLAAKLRCTQREVESAFLGGDQPGEKALNINFPNLLICCQPRLTVDTIEKYVARSELKLGRKPKLILIDYVQLLSGTGSRYEKASQVAEDLKTLAKATRTIIIIASQRTRPSDSEDPTVRLHDAKDSGSLENSCGLVFGAWRNASDATEMNLKLLKATKGGAGLHVVCNFDGERMMITERSPE
jgi:hypothetical protein